MNRLAPNDRRKASSTCLYPFSDIELANGYPTQADFETIQTDDGRGVGVRARKNFARGTLLCCVSGLIVKRRYLHTLQITPNSHLYDPHFCGLLLHSCDPNVLLDMDQFELWALKDIFCGDTLLMDYAANEDVLSRQFACRCGAPNCRGWITGSKERPNEDGIRFLNRN